MRFWALRHCIAAENASPIRILHVKFAICNTPFGIWCCWCACFALGTFVFRTSRVFGGKAKDRLPGINIGTQSILTGLAGISLLPFLGFFFSFFWHKWKTTLGRGFCSCFQNLSMKEGMWLDEKRMKYQKLASTFSKWPCVHMMWTWLTRELKGKRVFLF
jgi:hypothetical protein